MKKDILERFRILRMNMKNKIDILLNTFSLLNLSLDEYVIFGSGPMAIRGIKEPKDLDVLLKKNVWDTWSQKEGWISRELRKGEHYLENTNFPDIELYEYWGPGDWNTEEIINNSEIINGFRFANMEDQKRYKKLCNREKDIHDLKLIENYENLL